MKTRQAQIFHPSQSASNVVDLEELRSRLSIAQQDSLARQPEVPLQRKGGTEPGPRLVVLTTTREDRLRARREHRAWFLDVCASVAVVVMTLLFALRIML